MSRSAPPALRTLVRRYDPAAMDLATSSARIRLTVPGAGEWDAVLGPLGAHLADPEDRADAELSADAETWDSIAGDLGGGMDAFRVGRLGVRRNLHLGVGFLAATTGPVEDRALNFRRVSTRGGRLSTLEAGNGPPVLALHGLGATKASFLPTVDALRDRFRVIAVDLPGFGESDKPLGAAYDARFFARALVDLLDSLEIDRAHVIGNSMGGRAAIEAGLRHPDRVRSLALLAPSLAWRQHRGWATPLRFVRPELGFIQPAPRWLVEEIVGRVLPGAKDGWTAAGVDEFLRSYLTPRGRAAFYAAARQIYLEEPYGKQGFWPRLRQLETEALFVWGLEDRVVPIAFARHVREALPHSRHVELDCGHVPQLERPRETHEAVGRFFAEADHPRVRSGAAARRA